MKEEPIAGHVYQRVDGVYEDGLYLAVRVLDVIYLVSLNEPKCVWTRQGGFGRKGASGFRDCGKLKGVNL